MHRFGEGPQNAIARRSENRSRPRPGDRTPALRRFWPASVAGLTLLVIALILAIGPPRTTEATKGSGSVIGLDGSSSASPTAGTSRTPAIGLPSASKPAAAAKPAAATKPATSTRAVRRPVSPEPLVISAHGPGKFLTATVGSKASVRRGRLIRYHVRVEKGLPFRSDNTARTVAAVLNDQRSWRGAGTVRFELVPSSRKAGLEIYLATPGTTDKMCLPLRTDGKVSCSLGDKVILNADRWAYGVTYYGKDVVNYRRYLVNHEVGHSLGHDHLGCPGKGKLAPVMMQQTKGLDGCRPNPWPPAKQR